MPVKKGTRWSILVFMLATMSGIQQPAAAEQQQGRLGDFYELGDYGYFDPHAPDQQSPPPPQNQQPAQPAPTPPPAAPPSTRPSAPAAGAQGPAAFAPAQTGTPPAYPQGDLAAARADGRAFATPQRAASATIPTDTDLVGTIPGYTGATLPQEALLDDPDALTSQGTTTALSNEAWRMVTNPDRTAVALAPDALSRAKAVEEDPNAYLEGQSLAAGNGSCTPLPPAPDADDYYEASCNQGSKINETPRSCSIRMTPQVTAVEAYNYFSVPDDAYGTPLARYSAIAPYISSGVCKPTGSVMKACFAHTIYGSPTNKFCDDYNAAEYVCSADLNIAPLPSPKTGKSWHEQTTSSTVTVERVDECGTLENDAMCLPTSGDVCTEPAETRIIAGVAVTQPCWAWQRNYACYSITQASDCADIQANAQCAFLRDECLDGPRVGACQVTNKVYRCLAPDAIAVGTSQYICGDDVYCINGDCEPIVREASSEFKDALVGLHALGQANEEFDEATLTLFSGEKTGCHKPVFGLINCCAGKSSGLITTAAGAAALAGGPTAIAALATPFLTLFLCSAEEKTLDVKDRMGLCHNLGTYCSDKVLGICTSKRTAYCCFESKLTRIIQEQGRPQIGKAWGKPKKETCKGFSVDEFARLDLSVMDFTEVYAEFIDAAKLPDELDMARTVQQRIEDYLQNGGR